MTWNGFNIVCVNLDSESEFNDPRAITEFGFEAPKLTVKKADIVWSIQKKRGTYVYLPYNGMEVNPVAEEKDGVRYLRVADKLSSEDPLMDLPSCEEYRREQKMSSLA